MHYAYAMPILPGKSDAARQFGSELEGARKSGMDDLCRRCGTFEERYLLQETPSGDVLIVTGSGGLSLAEGDFMDLEKYPFDRWYFDSIKDITGLSIWDVTSKDPELLAEWTG